jgi:hypothetical protein
MSKPVTELLCMQGYSAMPRSNIARLRAAIRFLGLLA